ncbi:MAG: hypothetical protein ABIP51_06865 [Bacteroidia bacterium]
METATKINLVKDNISKTLTLLGEYTTNNQFNEFKEKTNELLIFIDNICEIQDNAGESSELTNNVYKSVETIYEDHLPIVVKDESDLNLIFEGLVSVTQPILD